MTMTPYVGGIKKSLKWMQNNAPNIQSLVGQKSDWYSQFHDTFWSGWTTNVFNIATASPFGIMIWCIILGVPASLFGLYASGETSWAYGDQRQNFIYDGLTPGLPNKNLLGGNFFGSGNTTILDLNEARLILMLRYAAMTSNGQISLINKMLKWIMNKDLPWDFPGKKYFYVIDSTAPDAQTATPTAPITIPMYMEYRIGLNTILSAQFINTISAPQYGIMPTCAGVRYAVIKET